MSSPYYAYVCLEHSTEGSHLLSLDCSQVNGPHRLSKRELTPAESAECFAIFEKLGEILNMETA